MKTLNYTDRFGNTYEVAFDRDRYVNNGNLYLGLYCYTEEDGVKYAEPYTAITTNIISLNDKSLGCVDTNNNGSELLRWLEDNNFAKPTGVNIPSGYCVYPLYMFDLDAIEEYIDTIDGWF